MDFALVDPLLPSKIISREMVRTQKKKKTSAFKPAGKRRNATRKGVGTVEAPAAMSTAAVTSAPTIIHGESRVRVVHKEFVGNVVDAESFALSNTYSINPGLSSSFPWLSQMANSWEQYKFRKLKYVFVSRSATSVAGSVIIAPDYDASEGAPELETQITAYQDAVEDVPWRDIYCSLRPASMHPMGPRKFVRNAIMPGDVKTYDVGNIYVAVNGNTTNVLGKLWVEYDVELSVPQIGVGEGGHPTMASQVLQTSPQTFTSNTPAAVLFDAPVLGWDPTGFFNQYNPATGAFVPPQGNWMVHYHGTFSDSDAENSSVYVKMCPTSVSNTALPGFSANITTAVDSAYDESVTPSFMAAFKADGTTTYFLVAKLTGTDGTLTSVANTNVLSAWAI